MSTAAYLRVSTDEQDHARQRRAVRECMKDNGLSAADDLWFSDKESRDLDYKRPDFQRMMRLVEKGSIRTIVVEKFDRFGVQDVDEWFAYRHKLRQHDCRLLSAIDGDLTGKDVSTMIRTFFHADQSEKEQMSKSQRVLSGKVQKAQDHAIWNGGVAPFGFDRACYDSQGRLLWMFHYLTRGSGIRVSPCKRCKTAERTADGNRPCVECERVECNGEKEMPRKQPKSSDVIKLVPSENQNRIDIIRAVFRWYIEQAVGTAAVAANCNDAGWKWYGREFTHEDVRRILTNPAYVGELAFNRHSVGRFHEFDGARVNELPLPKGGKRVAKYRKNPEARHVTRAGKWTALIDSKTWDAAQKKLKDREKGPRPPRNPDCWLKAILYCGNCRQPMIVRRIKKRVTYICKSYHNAKMYRLPCACGLNMVRHDVAEKVIMDYLARLKIDLASGSDREVLLKLYEVRGQKTDLLAQTIRKGIHFYAETIRETFRLERKKSRLAGMVDKLALAFDLLETLKRPDGAPLFGEQAVEFGVSSFLEGTGFSLATYEKKGTAKIADSDDIGKLIVAIEVEKSKLALAEIDQLQAEYDAMAKAKALASTERERASLSRQIGDAEERIDELESHLTPITQRRDDLKREIKALGERLVEAERAAKDGEALAKAEAIRNVLGKVYLHFDSVKTAKLTKAPLMPEKTEFETVATTAQSSRP